jgi:hypothetical protein
MVTTAGTPFVNSHAVPLARVSARSRQALMCGLLAVAVVLAYHHRGEIGDLDDWSTVRTAKLFAETGHFIYNGWLHSPEGWQIVWTAPFIKLFGFSYAVVRLSLLPIVFATVYLFQRCLVSFGLTEKNATFGALTLGLSPSFVPAASAYMTDIPSLFAVILCLFLCQKAVTATTNRCTCLWLSVAALTNLLLGTVRQTGWLGVLVIVPSVGLWLRHRRGIAVVAFTLTASGALGVAAVLHWFLSQPYSVPEELLPPPISKALLLHLAGQLAWAFDYLTIRCTLPILALFLQPLFRLRRRTFWLAYFAIAILLLLVYSIGHISGLDSPDELVIIAGKHTKIKNLAIIMERLNIHLSVPTVILALFLAGLVLLLVRRIAKSGTSVNHDGSQQPSWQGILWLLGPYSLTYTVLLIPRASVVELFDRYFAALAPLPIVALLALYQQRSKDRIPAFAVVVLALLAFSGAVTAESRYSEHHARLIAADLLRDQGIPRTAISNGYLYNNETELDVRGHVNEPEVRVPANAYKPYVPPVGLPQCASDLVDPYTPSVVPKFFLVSSPRTCLAPTQYAPISYKTMLPPLHRYIYIQQLPPD